MGMAMDASWELLTKMIIMVSLVMSYNVGVWPYICINVGRICI